MSCIVLEASTTSSTSMGDSASDLGALHRAVASVDVSNVKRFNPKHAVSLFWGAPITDFARFVVWPFLTGG